MEGTAASSYIPIKESLTQCKKRCKKAANELRYGSDVIDAINQAKTNDEITRIMIDARRQQT